MKAECEEQVDAMMEETSTNADRSRAFLRHALNKRSISLLGGLLDRSEIIECDILSFELYRCRLFRKFCDFQVFQGFCC
jgi:hypothetical protein